MKKQTLTKRLSTVLIVVVFGFLAITAISVNGLKTSLFEGRHQQTRFLVENVHTLIDHFYQLSRTGSLTEVEAQQSAINAVKALRYDENNYFWINDKKPVLIMHPYQDDLVGKNLSDLKDSNGKYLFNEFVNVVKTDGEGIVPYLWPKPGKEKPVEKISYVKEFAPWGWIVGSGTYVDDVEDAFLSSALFLGIVSTTVTLLVFTGIVIIRRESFFQKKEYDFIEASNTQLERRIEARTAELRSAYAKIKESRDKALRDKKKAEYSEAVFRGMSEAAQDAIILLDSKASVAYWNAAAERIFGFSADEIMGKDLHSFIARDQDKAMFEKAFPMFVETGQGDAVGIVRELIARRKSGDELPVELSINSVMIDSSWQAIGIVRDISDRKAAEMALKEKAEQQSALINDLSAAQDQLLQSEKLAAIGQLSAGVAHEINNPVGFIGSNLNSLKRYIDDIVEMTDQVKESTKGMENGDELLNRIEAVERKFDFDYLKDDLSDVFSETQEGVGRIQKIVADLKGFARASDGEWEKIDLHQEIDSTLNVVWNELKYHCTIKKQYGTLPLIECLRSEINQVIMNLLINASHAIEKKGTIYIRTGRSENNVWVEIEDTGKGINPEALPNIYDPFFTTKPVGKGTGLGLSVSYGIIEKHQGQLKVASEPSVGTKFTVTIPINQTEDEVLDQCNAVMS